MSDWGTQYTLAKEGSIQKGDSLTMRNVLNREATQWDTKYRAVPDSQVSHPDEPAEIVRRLRPRIRQGMRVLEAGSGTGRLLAALAEPGVIPVAVDFSEAAHQLAGRRFGAKLIRLRADLERLPFKDKSFDLAFSDSVLEHLSDPAAAAREIQRVVRTGGCFAATVPNRIRLDGWWLYAKRFRPRYILRTYFPWAFHGLLASSGWKVMESFGDILWLQRNWKRGADESEGRSGRAGAQKGGRRFNAFKAQRGEQDHARVTAAWKLHAKQVLRFALPAWAWVNIGFVCVKR